MKHTVTVNEATSHPFQWEQLLVFGVPVALIISSAIKFTMIYSDPNVPDQTKGGGIFSFFFLKPKMDW